MLCQVLFDIKVISHTGSVGNIRVCLFFHVYIYIPTQTMTSVATTWTPATSSQHRVPTLRATMCVIVHMDIPTPHLKSAKVKLCAPYYC